MGHFREHGQIEIAAEYLRRAEEARERARDIREAIEKQVEAESRGAG